MCSKNPRYRSSLSCRACLGPFDVFDISATTEPFENLPAGIMLRHATDQPPAANAIGPRLTHRPDFSRHFPTECKALGAAKLSHRTSRHKHRTVKSAQLAGGVDARCAPGVLQVVLDLQTVGAAEPNELPPRCSRRRGLQRRQCGRDALSFWREYRQLRRWRDPEHCFRRPDSELLLPGVRRWIKTR